MKAIIMALLLLPAFASAGEFYGTYIATIVRVKDGDTVLVDVAIWPQLTVKTSVRLIGVDTPEKRGSRNGKPIPACEKRMGQKATEFTQRLLKPGTLVTIDQVHLGKYAGRVLGNIKTASGDLGQLLISAKLARPYAGGKRQGWCK